MKTKPKTFSKKFLKSLYHMSKEDAVAKIEHELDTKVYLFEFGSVISGVLRPGIILWIKNSLVERASAGDINLLEGD